MGLKTISEANQDRLVSAIGAAMDNYNAGGTPSAAVAKAASDSGFNANYTKRLCDMFNASLTLDHLDEHRFNSDKRASEFPLADFTEVWSAMKQGEDKPVAKAASVRIADHTEDIRVQLDFSGFGDWGVKSASAVAEEHEKQAKARADDNKAAADRLDKAAKVRLAERTARDHYYEEKEKMASAAEVVINKLRRTDSCDFNTFKAAASNAYPDSLYLLDYLEPRVITNRGSLKVAYQLGLQSGTYVHRDFAAVSDALDAYGRLVATAKSASAALELYKKAEVDMADWITGKLPKIAPEYPEVRPTNFFKRLSALEGYSNLAKLMATDPVIGSGDADAKTVKRLYKEITKANPGAATQPIALRGFLRRGLESSPDQWGKSLDTYDVKQLVDTDLGSGDRGWGSPNTSKRAAEEPSYGRSAGIGALGGAGAGLLYSLVGGQVGDDWKDHLTRAAAGAGIGAGLGAGHAALKPRGFSTSGPRGESPVVKEEPGNLKPVLRSAAAAGGAGGLHHLLNYVNNAIPLGEGKKREPGMSYGAVPVALAGGGEWLNQRLFGGSALGSDVVAAGTGAVMGKSMNPQLREFLQKNISSGGKYITDSLNSGILSKLPRSKGMAAAIPRISGRVGKHVTAPTIATAMGALLLSRLGRAAIPESIDA